MAGRFIFYLEGTLGEVGLGEEHALEAGMKEWERNLLDVTIIFSPDHAVDYCAVTQATEQKSSLELREQRERNVGSRNNAMNQILVRIECYQGSEV